MKRIHEYPVADEAFEQQTGSDEVVAGAAHRGRGPMVAVGGVVLGVIVLAALLAGWPRADASGLLVRDGDGTIALLDEATGDVAFEVGNGVPTPDRSALLTTRAARGGTVLESRDARTGAVTGSTTLDGELHVRSVSPAGAAVVLMPGPRPANLYEPGARLLTDLTVAYLDDRPARAFRLAGNLEPEMLSLDETVLFVLEFSPPMAPTSYSVRKLDLETGRVTDTDSVQVDLTTKMAGRPRAQALHPDGTFLYTLYTLPSDQPVHDSEAPTDAERFAFVHVISLDEKWSYCVFLPTPFGTTDEATIGMTVSPDGDRLLIGDPAIGRIAEVDANELRVTGVHDVEQLRDTGERAVLAIAGDGSVYVTSGSGVYELDSHTFELIRAASVDAVVTGLSATDSVLRIAKGGHVVLVDRDTLTEIGVIRGPGRGTVDLLGPPGGSVVEFPLECAC